MMTSLPLTDADRRTYRRWAVFVALFYTVVAGGLFALASWQPTLTAWVSRGVQAEFAGSAPAPETIQLAAKRLGTR
jgi:hypothetical protein